MDLKKAIRRYAAGDAMDRDAVEHLRAAGLLSPVGYVITEMGRSLMLQNPSPIVGSDTDNPMYLIKPDKVELNQTFGKLGAAGVLQMYPDDVKTTDTTGQLPQPKGDLKQSAKDVQIGGDHYKKLGRHQPWEVLASWMTPEELRGHMKGTVIGYLAREHDKGGDTDVAKACHTMQLWEEVRKDK